MSTTNPVAALIENPDPFPPTPWRVERASGTLCPLWYVYDANDAMVAGGFGNEEAARLCAAAPEIRRALCTIRSWLTAPLTDPETITYFYRLAGDALPRGLR